jgi:hypothetical protein
MLAHQISPPSAAAQPKRVQKPDHAIDPSARTLLAQLSIARAIALDHTIGGAHLQYRMAAVTKLLFGNETFEIARGR